MKTVCPYIAWWCESTISVLPFKSENNVIEGMTEGMRELIPTFYLQHSSIIHIIQSVVAQVDPSQLIWMSQQYHGHPPNKMAYTWPPIIFFFQYTVILQESAFAIY